MFGRKDDKAKKRRTPRENLSQFGLDMNFDTNLDRKDDSDDSDLEAELLALTSDSSSSSKPKKARPKVIPQDDLNRMIAESMKDEGDDDDESVDENDPDLLGELNELTEENEDGNDEPQLSPEKEKAVPSSNALITLLEERLKMYQTAEANAKSAGETSRFKRFARGSKTLAEQLRAAKSGRSVKEEDIPPPVTTRAGGSAPPSDVTTSNVMPAVPVPTRSAPPPPAPEEPLASEKMETDEASNKPVEKESVPESSTTENSEENACPPSQVSEAIAKLEERRGQYRQAAVAAKRDGRKQDALNFALIVKKFDIVIEGVKSGESVDLSEIPPPPDEIHGQVSSVPDPARVNDERQASSEEPKPQSLAASSNAGPPAPKTVMEALIERLELYQKQEASAKADGNSRKERQMGRIVKQYQDAIKQHKAGRRFAMDELPTPPGFPPIPGSTPPVSSTPAQVPSPVPEPMSLPLAPVEPPATPHAPARSHVPTADLLQDTASGPNDATESSTKTNVRKSPASRQEKQLALLLTRQKDFKVAALQAKSRNELNQAKEYLRLAKGFDKLIEATQSGLPVDLKTLPVAPNAKIELETDFDIIAAEDCVPGSDDEVYERLLEDLKKQIQTCMRTRDHFKAIGDIASANRFENMAVHSKKDMDAVNHALKLKYPVPKFHYETRVFSIVQCCTDLTDNDLELTIIQGVNYNVPNPKDVDTYVRFELPWPSAEESQKDKTNLIKDTNNPVYDSKFTLQIQRTRACQRIFKRQSVKCEVWSRGAFLTSLCCGSANSEPRGFFRSDTLIGTANIKLQPLESKCIVHDSFDLMDGRKAVGGKLEVKMRIRNPIVTKQVEEVTEKWLVIDRL